MKSVLLMLILNAQTGEVTQMRQLQFFESGPACLAAPTPITHARNGVIEVFVCVMETRKDVAT